MFLGDCFSNDLSFIKYYYNTVLILCVGKHFLVNILFAIEILNSRRFEMHSSSCMYYSITKTEILICFLFQKKKTLNCRHIILNLTLCYNVQFV